jgi:hypothetical protein
LVPCIFLSLRLSLSLSLFQKKIKNKKERREEVFLLDIIYAQ